MAGIMDLFEGGLNSPGFSLGVGLLQGANPGGTFGSGMQQGLLNMQATQAAQSKLNAERAKLKALQAEADRKQAFISSNPLGTPAQAAVPAMTSAYAQSPAEMFPGEAPVPGLLNEDAPGLPARPATGLLASMDPAQGMAMQAALEMDPEGFADQMMKQQFAPGAKGSSDMQNYKYQTEVLNIPKEQAYANTFGAGSGTNVTVEAAKMPSMYATLDKEGNPVMAVGAEDPGRGTKTAQNARISDHLGTLQNLNESRAQVRPEYLEWGTQWQNKWNSWKEKAGIDLSPEDQAELDAYTGFQQQALQGLNAYIKYVTGAAMSEPEAKRIEAAYPNMDMSPTQFNAAMEEVTRDAGRAVLRDELMKELGFNRDMVSLSNVKGLERKMEDVLLKRTRENMDANPKLTKEQAEIDAYKTLQPYEEYL